MMELTSQIHDLERNAFVCPPVRLRQYVYTSKGHARLTLRRAQAVVIVCRDRANFASVISRLHGYWRIVGDLRMRISWTTLLRHRSRSHLGKRLSRPIFGAASLSALRVLRLRPAKLC